MPRMKPLRILQVAHGFPPLEHAGAELCCYYLGQELQRRGHAVRVFARTDRDSQAIHEAVEEVVDGLPVVRFRGKTENAGALRDLYRSDAARRAFEAELDRGPDVVHVHHLFGLSTDLVEAARTRGVPVVMTLHDFWYLCPRGQRYTPRGHVCAEIQPWRCSACIAKKRLRWAFNAVRGGPREGPRTSPLRYVVENLARRPIDDRMRFILGQLNQANLCLAPSRFVLDEYRRHGLHGPSDFSPNGMLVDWLPRLQARDEPHAPIRFGFLGSFLPSKGVDLAVEAFAGLSTGAAELHLHGTSPWDGGAFANGLRERTRHPDVHFHGAFPRERLVDVLQELDVLVVPSRWYENAPVALDEAALARRPVIASAHGGMKEWVERRGNGVLFRPDDAADLRVAMQRFVDQPSLWHELRDPKEPVRTVADQADEMERRYRELVG